METFVNVANPQDLTYQVQRQEQLDELLKMNPTQLERRLNWQLNSTPLRDEQGVSKHVLQDIVNAPYTPVGLKKSILDSTGTTTGNVLIRQDLEPTLYSLFVKTFPVFERMRKAQANGLVHAFNQISTPDSGGLGSTVIQELGSVSYTTGTYVRQTAPIAVFATGRGVSLKEIAAVQAGGVNYDPQRQEMSNGMIKLALDVQGTILQGNASTSGGAGASTELGAYNANAFDGLRSILGSQGTYSGNNAIQVDIGSFNILESLQIGAAKMANNGGMPSLVFMSMNAKQALDAEQQGNQRYINDQIEIIPGVRVSQVAWANGNLAIIPVPGTTMGSYTRASDGATVEDMYIVDESVLALRWLYSESFTVLQIPSGVDGQLSNRFLIFGMYGLEVAAPLFCGKVRRIAS